MTLDAVVDRIEGETAVLEIGGELVDWPVSLLPEGAEEGHRLQLKLTLGERPPEAPASGDSGPLVIDL